MSAQEAFEAMVAEQIWPPLKSKGFKRSKSTFHRQVGENWEVVNLQRSYYSDRNEVRFTANVGVGINRLRGGALTWTDGKRPPEYKCHFRERLGILVSGRDSWWSLGADTDTAALASSVLHGIERYGLPWLQARSTHERLRSVALGDLSSEYEHHLHLLMRLMREVGDDEASVAVEHELRRRADASGGSAA